MPKSVYLALPSWLRHQRALSAAFVTAVLFAFTVNCASSRVITRAKAADLIRDSNDFNLPVFVTISGKREWPTEARSAEESEDGARQRAVDSYTKTNAELATFRHLGLINVEAKLVEGPSLSHAWWRFELEPVLTKEGRQGTVESSGDKSPKGIAIARRELVEVTGVSAPQAGTARAEFTWRQVPTSAGEAFDVNSETYRTLPEWLQQLIVGQPRILGRSARREYGDIRKGEAFLQLYDDGWRVQHVQF